MKKPIGVEIYEFDLVKLKETAEEVVCRNPKSMKEKGEEDHYLFFIRHWVVVPMTRSPLEAFLFPDEPIHGKLLDVPFSDRGRHELIPRVRNFSHRKE